MERIGKERDEAEKAEEAGDRPLDGALAPVSLGREAALAAGLREGHRAMPALHSARDDQHRGQLLIRAE